MVIIKQIDSKNLPDWIKKYEKEEKYVPLRTTLKLQNILERWRYIKYFTKYQIGCSFKQWLKRQQIARLLRMKGYQIEEVPNPARLNAYKQNEWFLIDITNVSVGIMQFEKGDTSGVASLGRPYWNETLDLIHSTGELILTPFNSIHWENGKGVEV